MQKVGGIWSHIIFHQILFEGADSESWGDLEPYFSAGLFLRELMTKVGGIWSHIIFGRILFEIWIHNLPSDSFCGSDEKVGGIWSQIIFRQILFEGAEVKVGGIWSHNLPSDSF